VGLVGLVGGLVGGGLGRAEVRALGGGGLGVRQGREREGRRG
jgi:hypothetical protein